MRKKLRGSPARVARSALAHRTNSVEAIIRDPFSVSQCGHALGSLERRDSVTCIGAADSLKNYRRQELKQLEEALDSSEMLFRTYVLCSEVNPVEQLVVYKDFLQHIGIFVKQCNKDLGQCLQRGLHGMTKALARLQQTPSPPVLPTYASQSVQTEPVTTEVVYTAEPDWLIGVDVLKNLNEKARGIQLGKVTHRLQRLLESLQRMHVEVPVASEPESADFSVIAEELQRLFQSMKSEPSPHSALQSSVMKLDRETQASLEESELEEHLETIQQQATTLKELNDRIEVMKRERIAMGTNSNDTYVRDLENKCYRTDQQLLLCKMETKNLEVQLETSEVQKKGLGDTLRAKADEVKTYQQVVNELGRKNNEKINLLQSVEDELFEAKVIKAYAEEKLGQIEPSWLEKFARKFVYKPIERSSVITKYGIERRDFKDMFKNELSGELIQKLKRGFAADIMTPQTTEDPPQKKKGLRIRKPASRTSSGVPSRSSSRVSLGEFGRDTNRESNLESRRESRRESYREWEQDPKPRNSLTLKPARNLRTPRHSLQPGVADDVTPRESVSTDYSQATANGGRLRQFVMPSYDFSKLYNLVIPEEASEEDVEIIRSHIKELGANIITWEEALDRVVETEARPLYRMIKTGENAVRDLTQKLTLLCHSVGIQCNWNNSPLPELRPQLSAQSHQFSSPHKGSPSPAGFSSPSSQADLTQERFQRLKKLPGIMTVFGSEQELEQMPTHMRLELMKAMAGHTAAMCGSGMCKHLLRAMSIRAKVRGVPYPLKQATLALI